MSFKIIWDKESHDSLNKLENNISRRIYHKVEELSENHFSKDIKKLKGINDFRLRVGDYRVIFYIEKDTIIILKVGHRKNIYD
ncbi:MAG TPA: type II toxin-antitoxin system RelE/ParE family toxin [Candidatus Nanoarchaeia archaeon]|nr:type II toxin-antitoxin system RelE/ParE family toxin [Candidatus Nanoarchaeia archaeon]